MILLLGSKTVEEARKRRDTLPLSPSIEKREKRKKREEREKEPRQLEWPYIQTRKNRAGSARRDSESTGKVEAPPIPCPTTPHSSSFLPPSTTQKRIRGVKLRALSVARTRLSALAGLGITVTIMIAVTVAIAVTVRVARITTVIATTARATTVGGGTIPSAVARKPGFKTGDLLFERRDALSLVDVFRTWLLGSRELPAGLRPTLCPP